MNTGTTRDQIVEAADSLFYERGYEHTSFADIAGVVNISRGNFYYHFRTKDEILEAVINLRMERTGNMLNQWEAETDNPQTRIGSFINILIMNRVKIIRYGCPVGTLCSELAKLDHPLGDSANRLFTLFRNWLAKQFTYLCGKQDADRLAMHILARSQGVATLANSFGDEKFIQNEVKLMLEWLRSLTRDGV